MKYLVVAKDEDGTSFVVSQLDELEAAREKMEFMKECGAEPNFLFNLPIWQSIELFEVNSIELHQFERSEP